MRNLLYCIIILLLSSCSSAPVIKKKPIKKIRKFISLKLVNYLKTGRLLKKAVVYSGSNSYIAVADIPGNISIYSIPELSLKKRFVTKGASIVGLVFHNQGQLLSAAYRNNEIYTYPLSNSSRKDVLIRKGNFGQIRCITAHPNKDRVYLGNGSGEVLLLNKSETEPIRKKTSLKSVNYIQISSDAKRLALAGRKNILTLDTDGLEKDEIKRTDSPVISFAFSSDSKFLAAGTLFFRILLFKADSLDLQNNFEISMDPVSCLLFYPEKKWLISGSGKTGKGTLHILTSPKLVLQKKEELNMEEIFYLSKLSDGKFVIVSSDGTIELLKPVIQVKS